MDEKITLLYQEHSTKARRQIWIGQMMVSSSQNLELTMAQASAVPIYVQHHMEAT